MSFETAMLVFMGSGTILFLLILKLKRPNALFALLLASLAVLWGILAFSHWGILFPEQYMWMPIFFPVIGLLAAMNILFKSTLLKE